MGMSMKESGKTIKEMGKGSLHLPMGISMSVSLNKTRNTEKECLLGKMEALMMDNG